MDIGPPELLIILLVVVILFGGSRISQLGGELGRAIRSFRQGLQAPDSQTAKSKSPRSGDQDSDEQ